MRIIKAKCNFSFEYLGGIVSIIMIAFVFFSLKLFFGGLKMFVLMWVAGFWGRYAFLFRWYFSSVQIQKFLFQDCEAMIMVAVFCSVVIRMFWMKGVKKYTYVCIYSRGMISMMSWWFFRFFRFWGFYVVVFLFLHFIQ